MRPLSDAPLALQTKHSAWFRPFFSLRWRLAFVYVLLFCVFVTILSVFVYSSTSALLLRNGQMAFTPRVVEIRSRLLQEVCNSAVLQKSSTFLQQEATNDIDNLYLLDDSGRVIASSDNSLLGQPFPYLAPTTFNTAHGLVSHAFQAPQKGATVDGLLLSVAAPRNCAASQQVPAYLAAITSYAIERTTLSNILLTIVGATAVLIIIGALVIAFLTGVMMRPLSVVTSATQSLARGNLQQRVPIPQTDDEIGSLAASFNQMAEQIEETFEAQQASERRTRRFVSDASHELRTPITSLRGFTEVLMRGAKDDPETAQRVLKLMKNEAERMSRLVNDLLTLARLDEGRAGQFQDVDLVDVVVESVRQAKILANDDCKVHFDLVTSERLKLSGNVEQLKQMLLLLLDNGIKYGCTGQDNRVILRLDKKGNNALVQILDHGKGISAEDLPHVFDRFYRGEYSLSPAGTPVVGTGLGLAIAIAIAHAHSGAITVCSEPDKETVFTVTLPCMP